MTLIVDFTRLKTSWTKYDIVQVMDVISSEEKIDRYKKKKIKIDEPILRSFLGIKSLSDPTPSYWIDIQNYPDEKRLFALLSVIFTHGKIVKWFAEEFSKGEMKGVFLMEPDKPHTNIRSALVEAAAAKPEYRRSKEVPYDFSPILKQGSIGKLFKQVLEERIGRIAKKKVNEEEFYQICFANNFHTALSLTDGNFRLWLEGRSLIDDDLRDTFLITSTEFIKQLKQFVHEELVRHNLDFIYNLEYKKGFYLVQKSKFGSLVGIFTGIEFATFYLEQLSQAAKEFDYDDISNAKPEIPIVESDVLTILQSKFSLDVKKLLEDNLFKQINDYLISNYISKIDSVRVKNFYSIKELNLENLCSTNEIYLLGENGDGKTLVLMAIFLAFNQFYVTEKTEQEKTGKIKDLIQDNKDLILLGTDKAGEIYGKRKFWLNQFFAYGAHRGRYNTDSADRYGFMSLFDGNQELTHPVSWLKDQKLAELQGKKRLTEPEIFQNEDKPLVKLTVSSIQEMLHNVLEKNVSVEFEGIEVYFFEKGSKLKFDQLSEGYKSVIIFVCDLIFRLVQNQPAVDSTQDLQAIVLVDEIDLHLHPKWQFNIVKKLRILFPNIQFIFSTHSPAIIQGASDDAVIYRVYRNEKDGETRLSNAYFRKNLDHLMINSLVTSPLFGMESARMNVKDNNSDTSDSYLLHKINNKISEELAKRKKGGIEFISEVEIDNLINDVFNEDLGDDD